MIVIKKVAFTPGRTSDCIMIAQRNIGIKSQKEDVAHIRTGSTHWLSNSNVDPELWKQPASHYVTE